MTWLERLIVGALIGGVGIVYPLYSVYLRVGIGAIDLCLSPVVAAHAEIEGALKVKPEVDQIAASRAAAQGYERRSLVCRRVTERLGG